MNNLPFGQEQWIALAIGEFISILWLILYIRLMKQKKKAYEDEWGKPKPKPTDKMVKRFISKTLKNDKN